MKKLIFITILFCLLISIGFVNAAEEVNVSIDGTNVVFDQVSGHPFIDENNRTQVPFRKTLETFGAKVTWDEVGRVATAEKDGITVTVPFGERYVLKNGLFWRINDTSSLIKDNRIYLPIRIVFEAFGANVSWDAKTKTVIITTVFEFNTDYIVIKGNQYSTSFTSLLLTEMDLNDEDIIPLQYMTNLEELYMSFNPKISDLTPLSDLKNLKRLSLHFAQISDIEPLSELTNLVELNLGGNNISDLTPLSSLTKLTILRLPSNQISDLTPLSNLTKLTELSLAENQISDLMPLSSLTNLERLFLWDNLITDWLPVSHVRIVGGRP